MNQPSTQRRRGRWWIWLSVFVAVLATLGLLNALLREANEPHKLSSAPTVNADPMRTDGAGGFPSPSASAGMEPTAGTREPTVFTYFFYWYDSNTGAHLEPGSGQPVTLPPDPPPSWRSVEWFSRQFTDMSEAGVDIALPVYWGSAEEWSIGGLPIMAEAKRMLEAEGQPSPDIGLFFDTTILDGADLTQLVGKGLFYASIKQFFDELPSDQWATIDGRPIIWLYFSFFADSFDQSTFDYVYDHFEHDFGVQPYIVRELTWDFAKINGEYNVDRPIATEANYKWGAAFDGYSDRGSVAAVGPGFDEREIPGRGDAHRPRDDGQWYRENFDRAIESGKQLLVIETWNEVHEGSGVQETIEFGRQYIQLTRELVGRFKAQ